MFALYGPDESVPFIVLLELVDNLGRYLLAAGVFYVGFWIVGRRRLAGRRIQSAYPSRRHLWRELVYSVSTAAIFGAVGTVMFYGAHAGVLRLYVDVGERGVPYLVFSALLVVLMHDTYFYWTHRAMHLPRIYKHVHRVHHLSTNPSAWAAYAFAPAEAVVHSVFILLVALWLPLHPLALLFWVVFMIVRNVHWTLGNGAVPVRIHEALVLGRPYHNNASFDSPNHRYGISSPVWDFVFGTYLPNSARVRQMKKDRAREQLAPE